MTDLVRALTVKDLPELLNRIKDAGAESGWKNIFEYDANYIADQLTRMIYDDNWLVIGSNDVGAILIASVSSPWFTPDVIAQEQLFYAHPDIRNKGRVQALIELYIQWAKSKQAKRIHLGVNLGINNDVGNYLCNKFGFSKAGNNYEKLIEV